MQMISLIWGVLSVVGLGVAFVPCLGSLNWINIPFAIAGLILSIVATSNAPIGQRGTAVAGLVLNAIAITFGVIRLVLGGFIL